MERIQSLTVETFLQKLADPTFPGPASGSAATTMAGMAAALLEMSYKVTSKKRGGNLSLDVEKLERVRRQCLDLATEDVEALSGIIQAGKDKNERPEQYEAALKRATDTLVAVMENCRFIEKQADLFLPESDKRVYAEVAGSRHIAMTAREAARLGVEANLGLVEDEDYKIRIQGVVCEVFGD